MSTNPGGAGVPVGPRGLGQGELSPGACGANAAAALPEAPLRPRLSFLSLMSFSLSFPNMMGSARRRCG